MDRARCAEVVSEIEKLLYLDYPSALGETITRELCDYTVAFIKYKDGGFSPVGTGTLVSFLDSHYILTAADVWEEELKTASKILIPLKENSGNRYSITPNLITPFGPERPKQWNEWGPDIKLLRLPSERIGRITAAGRSFYNLSKKKEIVIDCGVETRFLVGAPAEAGTYTDKVAPFCARTPHETVRRDTTKRRGFTDFVGFSWEYLYRVTVCRGLITRRS